MPILATTRLGGPVGDPAKRQATDAPATGTTLPLPYAPPLALHHALRHIHQLHQRTLGAAQSSVNPASNNQCRYNRKRQRHTQSKRSPDPATFDSSSTLPPTFSTLARTTSMPTHAARNRRHRCSRREPRQEDKLQRLSLRHIQAACSAVTSPRLYRSLASTHVFYRDARSVVGKLRSPLNHSDGTHAAEDIPPMVSCSHHAHSGSLNPMIDRIPHSMGQRILDRLQQTLVIQPGLLPRETQSAPHVRTSAVPGFTHHPRKLPEQDFPPAAFAPASQSPAWSAESRYPAALPSSVENL